MIMQRQTSARYATASIPRASSHNYRENSLFTRGDSYRARVPHSRRSRALEGRSRKSLLGRAEAPDFSRLLASTRGRRGGGGAEGGDVPSRKDPTEIRLPFLLPLRGLEGSIRATSAAAPALLSQFHAVTRSPCSFPPPLLFLCPDGDISLVPRLVRLYPSDVAAGTLQILKISSPLITRAMIARFFIYPSSIPLSVLMNARRSNPANWRTAEPALSVLPCR